MLEDAGRIARRLLGPAHPLTSGLGRDLLEARAALRARENRPPSGDWLFDKGISPPPPPGCLKELYLSLIVHRRNLLPSSFQP